MSDIRLKRGLHFWLDGREYIIEDRLAHGDLKTIDVLTQETSFIAEPAILKLYAEERLQFETPKNTTPKDQKRSYLSADFTQIDEPLREEAKKRYAYVKAYFERNLYKRDQKTLSPLIEEVAIAIGDLKPPSFISLYRWIVKYEKSGKDIRSLITNHKAKGDYKDKIEPEVLAIINDTINELYLRTQKPTVEDVCSSVRFKITAKNLERERQGLAALKYPHDTTIYRRVAQIDPHKEIVGRYGRRVAERLNNFSGHEPPHPLRPMEVVEIDHSLLPFYVMDGETKLPIGRPTLTSAIEKGFGMPVGYYLSFEPPSSLSVMYCLLHAIKPKSYVRNKYPSIKNSWDVYGKPGILKCDNGPEFRVGKQLEDAALQVGFHVEFCPVKMPWYKSKIEGYFRNLNSILLRSQPGSFLKFAREFDDEYDPKKTAVVTLEALHEMIHIFIIDIICQMGHPTFGRPRSEVWQEAIAELPPPIPASIQDLKVLLGSVFHRVISRNGIEFEGLYYRGPELTRLRSLYEQRDKRMKGETRQREKAKIKIDPADISCLYVFDSVALEFVRIPAVAQQYTKGLSLWQHRKVKQLATKESKKVDIIALSLAKAKIQRVVEREWQNVKGSRMRTTSARWLGHGRNGIDIDEIEAYHEEQKNKSKAFASDNSSISNEDVVDTFSLNAQSNTPTVVASISDVGTALALSDAAQASLSGAKKCNTSENIEFVEQEEKLIETSESGEVETRPGKYKKQKRQAKVSSNETTSEQTLDAKQETESITLEIWHPNLEGWGASYRISE